MVADMPQQRDSEKLHQDEIVERRDSALRRALNTPPKPHDQMKLGKRKKKAKRPSRGAS